MSKYASLCDEFYVNLNLTTEMELPSQRETVLHFFEQIQRQYPTMRNFYCRERGEHVLEEEKENGKYRWATVEPRRILAGHVNPPEIDETLDQHRMILDLAPYSLAISPLDCESLNLMFGFDFTYRGNQNQLVAEALGVSPALEKLLHAPGATVISNEPAIQFALGDDCRTQARVNVETRTTAYHVRTGDFPEEQLSVYLTLRRYGSLDGGEMFVEAYNKLAGHCFALADDYLVENVLRPLQHAIAIN